MNTHSGVATKAAPATVRGQRTRKQVLDAAELVFGKTGYERASVADITKAAKVALGTFYLYFPSKEAVFVELVDELSHRLRRAIAERISHLDHRLDIEREGIRAFFEFCAKHRNLYRIIRQAEFVDEAAYRRYYRTVAAGYQRGLSTAMMKGHVRTMDTEVLAYALMGVADFVGMRFVLWDEAPDFDALVEKVTEFLIHGLEATPETTQRKPTRRKS